MGLRTLTEEQQRAVAELSSRVALHPRRAVRLPQFLFDRLVTRMAEQNASIAEEEVAADVAAARAELHS